MQLHRCQIGVSLRPTGPAPAVAPRQLPRVNRFDRLTRVVEQAVSPATEQQTKVDTVPAQPEQPQQAPAASSTPGTRDGKRNPQTKTRQQYNPSSTPTIYCTRDTGVFDLSLLVLRHPTLQASITDATSLRIVCSDPATSRCALLALAEANTQLSNLQSQYRIQVSASLRRRPNLTTYATLNSNDWCAVLFIRLVPLTAVTDIGSPSIVTKVSARDAVWRNTATFMTNAFAKDENTSMQIRSAKGRALENLYKAMLLGRYTTIRAQNNENMKSTMDAMAAAAAAIGTAATLDNNSSTTTTSAAPAVEVQSKFDLAFIPLAQSDPLPDGQVLKVVSLHIYKCAPLAPNASPELRLATPRISRAPSSSAVDDQDVASNAARRQRPRPRNIDNTTDDTSTTDTNNAAADRSTAGDRNGAAVTGTGTGAGAGSSRRNAPRPRPSAEKADDADKDSVTVSKAEWNSMTQQLQQMAARQAQLMSLLQATATAPPAPAVVPEVAAASTPAPALESAEALQDGLV